MATVSAIEEIKKEIKKDVEEFTKIAIEDKISNIQIYSVFIPIRLSLINHWSAANKQQRL
jgi:hypothetical protein